MTELATWSLSTQSSVPHRTCARICQHISLGGRPAPISTHLLYASTPISHHPARPEVARRWHRAGRRVQGSGPTGTQRSSQRPHSVAVLINTSLHWLFARVGTESISSGLIGQPFRSACLSFSQAAPLPPTPYPGRPPPLDPNYGSPEVQLSAGWGRWWLRKKN